jgi:hypothetical protein
MDKEKLLAIRHSVQVSVINAVSRKVAQQINGMQLISETLKDKTYRSTWMSADLNKCVVLMLNDITKPNYPAVMVKFGF